MVDNTPGKEFLQDYFRSLLLEFSPLRTGSQFNGHAGIFWWELLTDLELSTWFVVEGFGFDFSLYMLRVGGKPDTFHEIVIGGMGGSVAELEAICVGKKSVTGYLWSSICDRMLIEVKRQNNVMYNPLLSIIHFKGGSNKMKKLHIMKYWHLLLIIPIIIIVFFIIDSLNKAKINTPPFQFKQSIMDDIDRYVNEHSNDSKDNRQEYFFYLNSNASLSLFYSAIKNSTPMNYEAYMAHNQRNETTSESLVFILPCIKEQFNYFPKHLFCLEKKIVFQLNENDSNKLYEIITRLKSSQ